MNKQINHLVQLALANFQQMGHFLIPQRKNEPQIDLGSFNSNKIHVI